MWYADQPRKVETEGAILVGDVYFSDKYPNFTGIPKGMYFTVTSKQYGTIHGLVKDSEGVVVERKEVKYTAVINYLVHKGTCYSILNRPYVSKMAGIMGLSLSQDQEDLLVALTSKADINKKMLEIKEALPKVEETASRKDIELLVQSKYTQVLEQRKSVLMRDVNMYENNIITAQYQIEENRKLIHGKLAQIKGMGIETHEEVVNNLVEALKDPWFRLATQAELSEYTDNNEGAECIGFVTSTVVLVHGNVEVNLGKYMVLINPSTFQLHIRMFEKNIFLDNTIHPHVRRTICWGNAQDAVVKAMQTKDFARLLALTKSLLLRYNEDSPFRTIDQFKSREVIEQYKNIPKYSPYAPNSWVQDDLNLPDVCYKDKGRMYTSEGEVDAVLVDIVRNDNGQYAVRGTDNKYYLIDINSVVYTQAEPIEDDDDEYYDEDEEE